MLPTINANFCEQMYAHYGELLLTCTDSNHRKFLQEQQDYYQALHEKKISFEQLVAGIGIIEFRNRIDNALLSIYKQIALNRATRSKPNETSLSIVTSKNIIKVYSSDHVILAYVVVPGV